jgi:hypothetical protein
VTEWVVTTSFAKADSVADPEVVQAMEVQVVCVEAGVVEIAEVVPVVAVENT